MPGYVLVQVVLPLVFLILLRFFSLILLLLLLLLSVATAAVGPYLAVGASVCLHPAAFTHARAVLETVGVTSVALGV